MASNPRHASCTDLSHKSDPRWIVGAHVRAYCSLSTNEFSTEGLRALTTKLTTLPNRCQTLLPSPRLITLKILQGISSPFSLSPLCSSYVVATLYQKLDIGGRSKIYEDSFQNSILCLRRCISCLNITNIGL